MMYFSLHWIIFIIANSTDPGDMLPHLDLHSLYLCIGIQN